MLPLAAGLAPGPELLDPQPVDMRPNTVAAMMIANLQGKALGIRSDMKLR